MMELLCLPLEQLVEIAARSHPAAWTMWLYSSAFKRAVRTNPYEFRAKVITETPTETRMWGLLHSINDDPAMMLGKSAAWFRLGAVHRDDAPAVVEDGAIWGRGTRCFHKIPGLMTQILGEFWYCDGVLHRGCGQPAVILSGVKNVRGENKEWWMYGVRDVTRRNDEDLQEPCVTM